MVPIKYRTGDPEKPDLFNEDEPDDGLDEGFAEEECDLTIPLLPRTIIPGNRIILRL
jgi:hypothetical protein